MKKFILTRSSAFWGDGNNTYLLNYKNSQKNATLHCLQKINNYI